MRPVSTFSIVALDPETGDLGVATASKFLAVGAVVPWVQGGIGAVATQSYANTSFGPRGLALLQTGSSLESIAAEFAATDEGYQTRQYGLVNQRGDSFSFTGSGCHPWAGGRTGFGYAAQGNLLAGPEVVDALALSFAAQANPPLPERLLAALLAADRAGGDSRGRQSAALYVARVEGGYAGFNDRLVDLRVDDHPDPIPELQRLLNLHRLLFERPDTTKLLELKGDTATRLGALLVRAGALLAPVTAWNDAAQAALESVAGIENLEQRMVKAGFVDPRVLEYLEDKFGA